MSPCFFSPLVYIQENSAALNIMVGVLCNMLACCPEMQNAMMELGNSGEELTQNRLLERFGVPASIDELLEYVASFFLNGSSIYQSRAMEPMAHYPAPMLPSFDVYRFPFHVDLWLVAYAIVWVCSRILGFS